jgi:hypothetical protein
MNRDVVKSVCLLWIECLLPLSPPELMCGQLNPQSHIAMVFVFGRWLGQKALSHEWINPFMGSQVNRQVS